LVSYVKKSLLDLLFFLGHGKHWTQKVVYVLRSTLAINVIKTTCAMYLDSPEGCICRNIREIPEFRFQLMSLSEFSIHIIMIYGDNLNHFSITLRLPLWCIAFYDFITSLVKANGLSGSNSSNSPYSRPLFS